MYFVENSSKGIFYKNNADTLVVVVVTTPPLPRDGGTARTAIQVHAVNLTKLG